jgi:hypothetical protein
MRQTGSRQLPRAGGDEDRVSQQAGHAQPRNLGAAADWETAIAGASCESATDGTWAGKTSVRGGQDSGGSKGRGDGGGGGG